MTFRQFAYRNVFRNFRNYAAFFMASFFSVFVFFLYSMLMFHPEMESGALIDLSILGMVMAEFVLVIFSWFFIFYSLRAFLEARSKEFAILLHLGMDRRQLGNLVFLETMLIGIVSSLSGILFGFAFSKFFFMIVREILDLQDLYLYFSWKPFLLTLIVFMSAFVFVSVGSIVWAKDMNVQELIKEKRAYNVDETYSFHQAILGIALTLAGYLLAIISTKTTLIAFAMLIPMLVTFGTYFFFSDTIFLILNMLKRMKTVYWRKSRLLSFSEQTYMFRQNTKMFFIVTMVSTLAFLTVVSLAALSSYTAQYDKLNPLGIVYKGHTDNPYEREHIEKIIGELEENGFSYYLTKFEVIKQTSSVTNNEVEVLALSDVNQLLYSYGYPLIHLVEGQAMFIPYSDDSREKLTGMRVETVLVENNVPLVIDEVYQEIIIPSSFISRNSIVVSDTDYAKLINPINDPRVVPSYHLFAFDIPQWVEAKNVGQSIQQNIASHLLLSPTYNLPFYFENIGLNYSYISATYLLFMIVGSLVVFVFLLAAGSFIYFRLYANLERDRKQFAILNRLGLTEKEQKRLITRYLLPQFFLPWGIAAVHSVFAFSALQTLLKDTVNLIVVKEALVVFVLFVALQVVYFYMLRWRYIAHVQEK